MHAKIKTKVVELSIKFINKIKRQKSEEIIHKNFMNYNSHHRLKNQKPETSQQVD